MPGRAAGDHDAGGGAELEGSHYVGSIPLISASCQDWAGAPVREKIARMTETFAAFTAEKTDDGFRRGVTELTLDDLPAGDVVVDVSGRASTTRTRLAATEKGRVARISPIVPGIDLAGTVRSRATPPGSPPGDAVLAHGYDLGVAQHGGLCPGARGSRRAGSCRCPTASPRARRWSIGTAGYTAALSVLALLDHGLDAGRRHGARDRRDRRRRQHGGRHAGRPGLTGSPRHRQGRRRAVPPWSRRQEIIDRDELTDVAASRCRRCAGPARSTPSVVRRSPTCCDA